MIVFLACILVFVGGLAPASSGRHFEASVQIRQAPSRYGAACSGRGTLTARPSCAGADCRGLAGLARSRQFRAPSRLKLSLGGSEAWTLTAEAERCWAASVSLSPLDEAQELTMLLWPAARLRGRLETPKGMRLPSAVGVRIQSVPGAGREEEAAIPETLFSCPIVKDTWSCGIPAAPLDVRVAVEGFAVRYFWGIEGPAGKTLDLGAVRLKPGASVAGWVTAGGRKEEPTTVELLPQAFEPPALKDSRRLASRRFLTKATDRGFFQFQGVPEGSYSVRAFKQGFSSGEGTVVRVREPKEYLLRDALFLEPLARLEANLFPTADPHGRPWAVRLQRRLPLSNIVENLSEEPASGEGHWRSRELSAGTYVLFVVDSRGTEYLRREVELRGRMDPLQIELDAVAIEGRITVGEKPLKASLSFRWEDGSKSPLESDEEGRFSGVLAREGDWNVEVTGAGKKEFLLIEDVHVARAPGERVATVDIALPGGTVKGTVTDERGRPVSAGVAVFRGESPESPAEYQALTSSDGCFEASGISPGRVLLEARTADAQSGLIPYYVSETEDPDPVRLVVKRRAERKGRLISAGGGPVAGALIRYYAPTLAYEVRDSVSGPTGEFSVSVPGATEILDVVVIAPGFPVKITVVPIPRDPETPLEIRLGAAAGVLRVRLGSSPPWPYIRHEGNLLGLPVLFSRGPGLPPGFDLSAGATFRVELEAGTYTLCPEATLSQSCVSRLVSSGMETSVDTRGFFSRKSDGRDRQ